MVRFKHQILISNSKIYTKGIGWFSTEIRLSRYFIGVANQQSISAAAKYLHISQPTLSRQLSDLEAELGTPLFIRGNRKITLTNEGVFLLAKAKEIVELVDKTEANFNQPEEIISGEIYIGGGEQ